MKPSYFKSKIFTTCNECHLKTGQKHPPVCDTYNLVDIVTIAKTIHTNNDPAYIIRWKVKNSPLYHFAPVEVISLKDAVRMIKLNDL